MKDEERQTRTRLMELFEEHGFHPRNNLGQNFLIDLNIVEYIVDSAHLTPDDVVLEIGAGTGGMTTFLAQQAAHVVSVEIDENMFGLATAVTQPYDNISLINTDALRNKNNLSPIVLDEIQRQLDVSPSRKLKVVSNLPYSVATPVVSNLIATDIPWSSMVITIQYELGLRMAARPARNHYGALSVWLQSQAFVKFLKKIPPSVFWPRPKVNSAIVRIMHDKERQNSIANRPFLQDFLRRLFHQRRKLMRSVLVGMYRKQLSKIEVDDILTQLKFKENTRAEEVQPRALVELSNALYAAIETKKIIETKTKD